VGARRVLMCGMVTVADRDQIFGFVRSAILEMLDVM
jgi:hypothetical protein